MWNCRYWTAYSIWRTQNKITVSSHQSLKTTLVQLLKQPKRLMNEMLLWGLTQQVIQTAIVCYSTLHDVFGYKQHTKGRCDTILWFRARQVSIAFLLFNHKVADTLDNARIAPLSAHLENDSQFTCTTQEVANHEMSD